MPRKVVAKAARETPEMRALRAAVREELTAPLSEPRVLTEDEARREKKRTKRFDRDEARARERWDRAAGDWRAARRAREGVAATLSDEDARDLLAFVAATDAERARDEARAEKVRSLAAPVVTVPVVATAATERNRVIEERGTQPAEAAQAFRQATPESRKKRPARAGVVGFMADWRLWDEP